MAIKVLEQKNDDAVSRKEVFETFGELLGVWGKKALMEMPSVTPTISEIDKFNDSVNRATVLALINDVKNADGFKDYSQYEYLFDQVDNIPSVTPTRQKGKWIDKEKIMFPICSKCGLTSVEKYSFCPNCGAEMES